jgi:hypothetical protein
MAEKIGLEGMVRGWAGGRNVGPSSPIVLPPPKTLITPALFSHRTPPNREKREWLVWKKTRRVLVLAPPLPVGRECGGRGGVGVVRAP